MLTLTPAKIKDLKWRYLPKGWRMRHPQKYEIGLGGLSSATSRYIYCPKLHDDGPDTGQRFHVFFHECGHVHLGHFEADLPRHIEEFEADRYALMIAGAEGFRLTYDLVRYIQKNVGGAVKEDRDAGRPISKVIETWLTLRPDRALPLLLLIQKV